MMGDALTRYNFNRSMTPPAPFAYVKLLSRDGLRGSQGRRPALKLEIN
jgi:hypothetical protein